MTGHVEVAWIEEGSRFHYLTCKTSERSKRCGSTKNVFSNESEEEYSYEYSE
jgi:hypothetical protein